MNLAWLTRAKGIFICSAVEGTVKIFCTYTKNGFRINSVIHVLAVKHMKSSNIPRECHISAEACWAPAGTAGRWTWRGESDASSWPSVWPPPLWCSLQLARLSRWRARTWKHETRAQLVEEAFQRTEEGDIPRTWIIFTLTLVALSGVYLSGSVNWDRGR